MMHERTRRTYRKPPLVEAVVEFQFNPPTGGWKNVYAGKIHSQIEGDYPRIDTLQGAQFQIKAEGGALSFGALTPAPEVNRFLREDGAIVVTVGPDVLGVSVLPPKSAEGYPGWPALRQRALELLRVYQAVVKPAGIRRLGVRYINTIPIVPGEFRLGEVVSRDSGLVPEALLEEQNPFSLRLERIRSADDSHRHTEIIQLSAQPLGPGQARLLLDVDQVWTPSPEAELRSPLAVLDELHDAIDQAFITFVRAEVLESFEPVEH